MLQFVALPQQDTMSISNASAHFDVKSRLPADVRDRIEIIAMSEDQGSIEYNDRVRLLEPLIDLVPYASLINGWLEASESRLTLTQAKTVMKDLITALYINKTQMPYPYAVSGTTYRFKAVGGASQSALSLVTSLTTDINRAITQFNDIDNYTVFGFRWGGGATNTASSGTSGPFRDVYPMFTYRIDNHSAYDSTVTIQYYTPQFFRRGGYTSVGRDTGNFSLPSYTGAVPAVSVSSSATPWESIDPPQIVSLTAAQATALTQGIEARNAPYVTIWADKINDVLGRTTILEIINYDATLGW